MIPARRPRRLYALRHAQTAGVDAALSEPGWRQAAHAAEALADLSGRALPIITSPLRRCRETASLLAVRWQCPVQIDLRATEFPSPRPDVERRRWQAFARATTWAQVAARGERLAPGYAHQLDRWRNDLLALALTIEEDCVLVTHAMAIASLASQANGDDHAGAVRPESGTILPFEIHGKAGAIAIRRRTD